MKQTYSILTLIPTCGYEVSEAGGTRGSRPTRYSHSFLLVAMSCVKQTGQEGTDLLDTHTHSYLWL